MMDTSTISTWLGVIAVASLLQVILLMVGAIVAWRTTRQVQADLAQAVARLERQHVEPLVARINGVLDDVHDVTTRAREIDDTVRHTVSNVTGHAVDAMGLVRGRVWPALALGRAAYAAVSSFRRRRRAGRAHATV